MRVRSLPAIFNRGMAILEVWRRQKSAVPSVCNLADELHPFVNIHHRPVVVMRVR